MNDLLNLALGILASFIAWFLVQRIRPSYRWAPEIAEAIGEPSGLPVHQVKIARKPKRWWRPDRRAVDVSIVARVAILGVEPRPRLEKIVSIPVLPDWRPRVGSNFYATLVPEECDPRQLRYLPDEVKTKRSNQTLRLDDLLTIGEGTALRMYLLGYDQFSGARWMLSSQPWYTSESIRRGHYRPGRDLEIDYSDDGAAPRVPDVLPGAILVDGLDSQSPETRDGSSRRVWQHLFTWVGSGRRRAGPR